MFRSIQFLVRQENGFVNAVACRWMILLSVKNNGTLNKEYCKWCYTDGTFVYQSLEELIDFLVGHMSNKCGRMQKTA